METTSTLPRGEHLKIAKATVRSTFTVAISLEIMPYWVSLLGVARCRVFPQIKSKNAMQGGP